MLSVYFILSACTVLGPGEWKRVERPLSESGTFTPAAEPCAVTPKIDPLVI